MGKKILEIRKLSAWVGEKEVLGGVELEVLPGQVVALMGPNGSGKTSLARVLMGDPLYKVREAKSKTVRFSQKNLLSMGVNERAKAGLFVAWQSPVTIPGVTVFSLCKAIYEARGRKIEGVVKFKRQLVSMLNEVGLSEDVLGRGVNEAFSGGEKKRLELVQMMVSEPQLLVLDEIDSGLDVDAKKLVGEVVTKASQRGAGVLLITHYARMLEHIKVDKVYVIKSGKIVKQGEEELVERIEKTGFRQFN